MQAKFRGWQVLHYFAWTIIRGKVQNLQNISRVKINKRFERHFSHHWRSISRNVASLNISFSDTVTFDTDDGIIMII